MNSAIQLQAAFRLALSVTLFYWFALWMDWDLPKYGALAIVLISLGTTGASLHKGLMRIVGTTAGLAVGMLALALFAQDPWLMLVFIASYLTVVGYFMQTSRYGYAWFVAGFLAPLVWSTTYGDVDNAFHYASFRYLETSVGIVLFTLVSVLLWPRSAGDDLDRLGNDLWAGLRELFGHYRQQLDDGTPSPEAPELRARIRGVTTQMRSTLQAAYTDTPSVAARKSAWEALRVNVRALCDALELWRESIGDARRLSSDRLLPQLDTVLGTIEQRLARIADLWQARSSDVVEGDDGPLLTPLPLDVDRQAAADLSHFDRAAVLGFTQQLQTLDMTSRELLRTMRVLADLESVRALQDRRLPPDLYRPSRWDPVRLINALLPGLCFTFAYLFWIYYDPPTGPSVPMIASTFALIMVLAPVNALSLIPVVMVAMWVAIAPVYFFVMPRLDTGFELLAVIFGYIFVCSVIWAKKPLLKTMALALFVMMTGISNEQVYSFLGLVDGGLMMLLGLGIIAVVQMLLSSARPEQSLLRDVRRFFRGCGLVTRGMEGDRRVPKRYFESMVLPVPGRLQAVEQKLDYTLFPDNDRDKVHHLVSALQAIVLRLQALELARARVIRRSVTWSEPLATLGGEIRELLQRRFERWSRFETDEALHEDAALKDLAHDVGRQLDATELDDQTLADVYAMLGCARGLVHVVAETEDAMSRLDWNQWAEARF